MSHMRTVLTVALLASIAAIVPQAQAQVSSPKAIIAGSSAMWQATGLGAYNFTSGTGGHCITGFVPPCAHYTSKNFQVNDRRPTALSGTTKSDANSIWIVWDSHKDTAGHPTPNFLAYIKVDSVVGDRCYYGQPRCDVTIKNFSTTFPTPDNLISVWADKSTDKTPPLNIQSLFTAATGPLVSAAATDVRAEDGQFAMCRANSAPPASLDAAMKGLGYNPNNAAGTCPTVNDLAHLTGGDVSDLSGSTAHILAFNVQGTDPFTGTAIVAGTTVSVGAAPIIPIAHVGVNSSLSDVTNVTDAQWQAAQGTGGCTGTTFGGASGTDVDVFNREPLSGTYQTAEYNIFAYPNFSGTSQEAFLDLTSAGSNPLSQPCHGGGGNRIRGVGTSHVIDTGTVTDTTHDSIAYTFFSYGNVSAAADAKCSGGHCRYLTLDGVDGIFHKYVATGGGTALDPGQPNAQVGQIPSAADLPAAARPTGCGTGAANSGSFPCREDKIWAGGLSFPNVRNGSYRAWSILRLISDGTALTNVKNLVASSQVYAVTTTPDYVPFVAIAANTTTGFPGDPGLQLLRSHYQQEDNAGVAIGGTPINDSTTGDQGGDVGGCIEHATPGATANQVKQSDSVTGLIHTKPDTECSIGPGTH